MCVCVCVCGGGGGGGGGGRVRVSPGLFMPDAFTKWAFRLTFQSYGT